MSKNPKKSKMFCIVSDNDGHQYVVPTDKVEDAEEYFEFMESGMENEKFDEEPEWLVDINGPVSKVHFTKYEIVEK